MKPQQLQGADDDLVDVTESGNLCLCGVVNAPSTVCVCLGFSLFSRETKIRDGLV